MLVDWKRWREHANEDYTHGEELIHSATHGVAAALSIPALVILVVLAITRGSIWHLISYPIYGITLVGLFTASTLFHGVQVPRLRPVFRKADHAFIYLFIAGTYTPFILVSIRNAQGWTMLTAVWTIALVGIIYKIFFIEKFLALTSVGYVLMGLMSLLAWRQMVTNLPDVTFTLILIGGALYLIGFAFYALTWIRYTHAVWHVLILAGSACFFAAVLTLLAVA